MSVRNCGELGENLQKVVSRLMQNDNLAKLLYYENFDPLDSEELTKEEKQKEIYNKLLRFVPRSVEDETNKSIVFVYIARGQKISGNNEFTKIDFTVDVVTPLETWVIKDSNLRPFAILGEIQKSLEGKTINGLGKIQGEDFELVKITNKISVYSQTFSITEYA